MNIQEASKPKIPIKFAKAQEKYLSMDNFDRSLNTESISNTLKKLGWTLLSGDGYYSDVYANQKKPYILKINKRPDAAYAYYVSIIRKYKNNPHFPKISDLKVMNINGVKYYIYLIEKLKPLNYLRIDDDNYKYELLKILSSLMRNPDYDIKNKYYRALIRYLQKNPKLIQAAKIIGKYHNKSNFTSIDLHDENIMQREDGTIVITDPLS